jgi:hypothetical protein
VGVLCELSLVPLYAGQRPWLDIVQRLVADGFELWSVDTGLVDGDSGRTLQVDAGFFRIPPGWGGAG